MKTQSLAATYNQVLAQRKLFLVLSGILLLLNILLSLTLFKVAGNQRVIVTPASLNAQFWSENDMVSESYLEQMSGFFTNLILNVSPANFAARSAQLLQHVAPSDYALVKSQLVAQQAEIELRGMSTSFHPLHFKVDSAQLVVEVQGELRIMVGGSPMELKNSTYRLYYTLNHGRLYIKKFTEITYDK